MTVPERSRKLTSRPALSTPRPLPRKREHAKKRSAIALANVNGTSMQSDNVGLTPANAIQMNEASADTRRGRFARLDALRLEIDSLITDISHAADIELLDLMADEVGMGGSENSVGVLAPANCGTGRRKASANGAWPAPSDRQFTYKATAIDGAPYRI
ncbi:hypothetical protein [Burkholderia ubonensis]|uniref:hypothetical protein n=1 Tax=Burkholderia ubonensis TaxID=101571 RepID=UPI001E48E36E|nr:hypothetical protein [Burkholderia ubonensis]